MISQEMSMMIRHLVGEGETKAADVLPDDTKANLKEIAKKIWTLFKAMTAEYAAISIPLFIKLIEEPVRQT